MLRGGVEPSGQERAHAGSLRVLVSAFACCPSTSSRFSGGEDILGWHLVKQIARFHETYVLTHAPDRADIEQSLAHTPELHLHFEYVALPRWLRPLQRVQGGIQLYCYLWQIRAYFVARKLLARYQFDLIHHLTYANDWMASFLGALLPVPYIRGPGGGAHRVPAGLLNEYPLAGRIAEQVRTAMQWLFRHDPFFVWGQRRARKILVCNREARNALAWGWRTKAVLFPVNGVSSEDLTCLNGSSPTGGTQGFHVLSAGKLMRLKGFPLALKAFKRFSEHHPDAQLEIIGDGPDRHHLLWLIDSLGLKERVRLTLWKPREEFLSLLSQCDVFLFPSLRDGGGAVVVEAMGAGKPVVCLDLGGPGWHVTDTCGIKVAAHDPKQVVADLAEALETLHQDDGLRFRMGQAARERARSVYHWDRLGERLRDIYQDVLAPQRSETETEQDSVLRVGVH